MMSLRVFIDVIDIRRCYRCLQLLKMFLQMFIDIIDIKEDFMDVYRCLGGYRCFRRL